MRLLVVTQKVDRNDPILGFFHGWLRALGVVFRRVEVIGQLVGEHQLPNTVTAYSLGKERGFPKFKQVMIFWRLLWTRRKDYDAALVHMTPIWVVLGAPLWFILGKPVYLWYEARGGGWALRVASLFTRKIFSASPSGIPFKTAKSRVIGHGIDTEIFQSGPGMRDPYLLLTVGRVTEAKNLPAILKAFAKLPPEYRLMIAGKAITPADERLLRTLRIQCEYDRIIERVEIRPMTQQEVVKYLQTASLFLHASDTALDKALLEAMAAGCIVLSSSRAAVDLLPAQCLAAPDSMAEAARRLLALAGDQQAGLRKELRNLVVEYHSLERLARRLHEELS